MEGPKTFTEKGRTPLFVTESNREAQLARRMELETVASNEECPAPNYADLLARANAEVMKESKTTPPPNTVIPVPATPKATTVPTNTKDCESTGVRSVRSIVTELREAIAQHKTSGTDIICVDADTGQTIKNWTFRILESL